MTERMLAVSSSPVFFVDATLPVFFVDATHVRMGPCVHVCVRPLARAHGCACADEPQKDLVQVSVVIGHAVQCQRQRLLQHSIKY